MNVLIVSNGHGEAAIAGYLGRALLARSPAAIVEHFPLVGIVDASHGPGAIVGPQQAMPSGGLVAYWNVRNLFRDLGAGLAALTLRQFRFLSRQRQRDVVVAVGDVYCLAACLAFARRPTVFVATAKSVAVAGHSRLECAIARRASVVFTRDAATAQELAARGVNARYAGNLMMDGVEDRAAAAPEGAARAAAQAPLASLLDARALYVGILPGSREDAPGNAEAAIRRLQLIAQRIAPRRVQALLSVAPTVAAGSMIAAAAHAGVALEPASGAGCVVARGTKGAVDVLAVSGCFGDLLRACDVVLGQAGTGNEQAAGLGKPVIAAAQARADGSLGWYRMRQQRLLGDALLVLPDEDRAFADGVAALLADSQRMQDMAAHGRARMGGSGGSDAVAQAVLALVSEKRG